MKNYCYVTYINGKVYGGKHRGELDDGYYGSGVIIQRMLKKYEVDDHVRIEFETEELAYEFEELLVFNLKEKYGEDCINIAKGGKGGQSGVKRSDSTKAKMEASWRYRPARVHGLEAKVKNNEARYDKLKAKHVRTRSSYKALLLRSGKRDEFVQDREKHLRGVISSQAKKIDEILSAASASETATQIINDLRVKVHDQDLYITYLKDELAKHRVYMK